jgi:hypothetical protein
MAQANYEPRERVVEGWLPSADGQAKLRLQETAVEIMALSVNGLSELRA